jgi:ATP-binding protein involved in chromosome partitioning
MTSRPALIKKIWQKDAYTFSIEWNDGAVYDYRLSHLQRLCPCAGCVDENTGKRRSDGSTIPDTLSATRIVSVGRYALKIDYKSGCSAGIYGFDMLKAYGKEQEVQRK